MNKALLLSRLSLVLVLTLSFNLYADIPPRPSPPRLVNDFANILSQKQEQDMEYKLRLFHHNTSNQIVVLIVRSLNAYDPASFAFEVGEKWGVGQKDFNNGIIILVKPKYGETDQGETFIAIGYGLEAAIPDGITKRIIENEMIPYFSDNDYYGGINSATDVLMAMASGEITAEGYNKESIPVPWLAFVPFLIFFIIFLLIRVSNAKSYSIGHGTSFWTALWLGNIMGGSHSGSWNNFTDISDSFSDGSSGFGSSGGGFGGGSSSGGGFSGFGGGSFGGGGAGGSW